MRIGIVSDEPLAVDVLQRTLSAWTDHSIAWVASNGAESVARCRQDTPGLVLMSLQMAGMDGVEATRQIMAATPCPILLMTVSVDANIPRVFEAMGYGALDAVEMPALGFDDPSTDASLLLRKIAAIGKLINDGQPPSSAALQVGPAAAHHRRLVVIGASAGGPAAVATLLLGLPDQFPAAIVVVQHVDEQFVPGMAAWLGQHTTMPVLLARDGDTPKPGVVLIAATGDHLYLKTSDRLGYTPEPRDYVYRPSVDVFFESVSTQWQGTAIGVLLTGMGRDGAKGLKALRSKGHHTIAQDRATSTVYGMPKAAATIGAADEVLPLQRIAPRLIEILAGQSSGKAHHERT